MEIIERWGCEWATDSSQLYFPLNNVADNIRLPQHRRMIADVGVVVERISWDLEPVREARHQEVRLTTWVTSVAVCKGLHEDGRWSPLVVLQHGRRGSVQGLARQRWPVRRACES